MTSIIYYMQGGSPRERQKAEGLFQMKQELNVVLLPHTYCFRMGLVYQSY